MVVLVDVMSALVAIKRSDVRAHVDINFSMSHMVYGYESAFSRLIGDKKLAV